MKFALSCKNWWSNSALILIALGIGSSALAAPRHGVYRGEADNRSAMVAAYSRWLNNETSLAQGHQSKASWADVQGQTSQLSSWSVWVNQRAGRIFNYTVAMFPTGGTLEACAGGQYDSNYRTLANKLVAYNFQNKIIIRIGWEFNIVGFPWYAKGKESVYAGCFRRIVDQMRSAQPNGGFKFDWNPNYDVFQDPKNNYAAAYPGNAYVDYIGIDLYDQGWNGRYPVSSTCTGTCRTNAWTNNWNVQMVPNLNKILAFAQSKGKPISVPEWGLVNTQQTGGGDNTVFIQKMVDWIYNPANNVAYHSYFDHQTPVSTHQMSNVDPSNGTTYKTIYPNAGALYKKLIASKHGVITPVASPGPTALTIAKAAVSAASIARGQNLTVSTSVYSPSVQRFHVKLYIKDTKSPNTQRHMVEYIDQVATAPGQTRPYSFTYKIPTNLPLGTYRIDSQVFDFNWKSVYRNDTTFTVK